MLTWFKDEKSGESGQGMVEYGLILVLVSIAAIAGLSAIGGALDKKFDKINGNLGGERKYEDETKDDPPEGEATEGKNLGEGD